MPSILIGTQVFQSNYLVETDSPIKTSGLSSLHLQRAESGKVSGVITKGIPSGHSQALKPVGFSMDSVKYS
jgi:hypothetical protein